MRRLTRSSSIRSATPAIGSASIRTGCFYLATEWAATRRGTWGFRIRTVPLYAGKPLRIESQAGDLRLFHRRHFLRRGEMGVQGTVVRLNGALTALTFASANEHRDYLARTLVPHSSLRRMLIFARNVLLTRARDANTIRYLWIEAGFDHGASSS